MKSFFLFAAIIFASFIHTELASVPRRRARKGGNLAKIVLPYGINFDEIFNGIIFLAICILVVAPMMLMNQNTKADRAAKKQKIRDDNFERNGGKLLKSRRAGAQLIVYSADDIVPITKGFQSEFPKLGSCCRGFYRGTLPGAGGREVLVVEVESVPRPQLKRFVDQLIFLSRVPHMKNVVRVIGCCLEKPNPLIVYELHGEGARRPLSECTRGEGAGPSPMTAAIVVARGLAYLSSHKCHKCSRSKFVHGDICTATVLVDTSHNAEIFYAVGSNLIPRVGNENDVYRDPIRPGTKLRRESDVYSFGVVLVELLLAGGRTALLNEYVNLAKAGRLRDHLDNVMASEPGAEMRREVAAMAEMCLNESPSKRPSMKKVEKELSKLLMPI